MYPSTLEVLASRAVNVLRNNTVKFKGYRVTVPHLLRYPIPYCWDTAFHALAFLLFDITLARENIECLLSLEDAEGKIPNAPTEAGDQDLRSQPPIIIYSALRFYEVVRTRDILEKWYPSLKRYYWWWREKGDPLRTGFISPFTGTRAGVDSRAAYWAVCSTGMDNHPVYDFADGTAIEVKGLFYIPVKDLLLTSSLALAARALAEMARLLNYSDDEAAFKHEYQLLSERMKQELWDDKEGFFFPVDWKGYQVRVKTVQAFTTLIAGIPDGDQRKSLVHHLTAPEEFWGTFGIPSVAFDDKKYMTPQPGWYYSRDPYYWRGPIWAPTTYIVFRGLLDNGYVRLAVDLAQRWLSLVVSGEFPEYFYADGRPGASGLSNFGWTASVTISMLVESGLLDVSKILQQEEKNNV